MQLQYDSLLALLAGEEAVVGVWLGGSRGKGYHDEHSDYDLVVIVRDAGAISALAARVASLSLGAVFDLGFKTLAELRDLARWGRADAWMRYAFADTRAVVDKAGEVQPLVERIGSLPRRHRRPLVARRLDAYLNSTYRSVKAYRRGRDFAARLEGAHAVEHLLVALFALHGRFKPYNDYLDREMRHLRLLGGLEDALLARLSSILATAQPRLQFGLRDDMVRIFRAQGFGEVFDSWQDHWIGIAQQAGDEIETQVKVP